MIWAWIKNHPRLILWGAAAILAVILCIRLIDFGQFLCKADQNAARIVQLEATLAQERAYLDEVLQAQAQNQSFITRQRKALSDAKEDDAPAASVLINTINRLHGDARDSK
jgi:Tfp pilus assembly protein PilE